jgi:hypothetical protein
MDAAPAQGDDRLVAWRGHYRRAAHRTNQLHQMKHCRVGRVRDIDEFATSCKSPFGDTPKERPFDDARPTNRRAALHQSVRSACAARR